MDVCVLPFRPTNTVVASKARGRHRTPDALAPLDKASCPPGSNNLYHSGVKISYKTDRIKSVCLTLACGSVAKKNSLGAGGWTWGPVMVLPKEIEQTIKGRFPCNMKHQTDSLCRGTALIGLKFGQRNPESTNSAPRSTCSVVFQEPGVRVSHLLTGW